LDGNKRNVEVRAVTRRSPCPPPNPVLVRTFATTFSCWSHLFFSSRYLPRDVISSLNFILTASKKHVQANSLDQAEKRGAKRKEGMSSKEAVTTAEETHVEGEIPRHQNNENLLQSSLTNLLCTHRPWRGIIG